ncbi:YjcZ family sporulation protein [Alkalihalobacterium alkalinitrilicum]|nr:YjcZ family sporulation protein [Alkalihalobacterium alkalinitrilicum]
MSFIHKPIKPVSDFALIVVLFILLIIVGTAFVRW